MAWLSAGWIAVLTIVTGWFSAVDDWTKDHAGLGGWVGAIGALLAILATWFIARREYRRGRQQERARKRAEIDLFLKIISDFEAQQVHRYFGLRQELDKGNIDEFLGKVASFYSTHDHDPEWRSMLDLDSIPVTNWPTVEIYVEFKRYWFATEIVLAIGDTRNTDKARDYDKWKKVHDESHTKLMELLLVEQKRLG